MPLSYHIDVRQKCVFMTISGHATEWDIGTGLLALWVDPVFDPHFSRLVDASGTVSVSLGEAFIRAVAQDNREQALGRVALVGRSEAMYEVFRKYECFAAGLRCRTFRTVEEAARWLEVDVPQRPAEPGTTMRRDDSAEFECNRGSRRGRLETAQ
jgi:hypothetical protein